MQSLWNRFCHAVQKFQLHPLACDPGHISNVSRPQFLVGHRRRRDTQLHRVLAGERVQGEDVAAAALFQWDPWTRQRDMWASAQVPLTLH